MGGIKTTAENLQAAIDGEGYEFKEMYPEFLKLAETEKNMPAVVTFKNAMAVEEIHHGLYGDALSAVKAGKDLPASAIYVCQVCGNTVFGSAPDKCPVCGVPRDKFIEIK